MREEAVRLGEGGSLVGVLTVPEAGAGSDVAFVLLNAGLIHRVGPKRLYVRIARALASLGFVVLRFDLSGLGDSEYRRDDLPEKESVRQDVRAAMDLLCRQNGFKRFVLMGICAGSVVSFVLAGEDPRVVGAGLIDPSDFGAGVLRGASPVKERAAGHYFRLVFSRPFTVERILRFLSGGSNYSRAFASAWTRLRRLGCRNRSAAEAGEFVSTRIRSLIERGTRLLVVYTEHGDSLDFVRLVLGDETNLPGLDGLVTLRLMTGADHDFTLPSAREELLDIVGEWSRHFAGAAGRAAGEEPVSSIERSAGSRADWRG